MFWSQEERLKHLNQQTHEDRRLLLQKIAIKVYLALRY
jgi:hypothetical protein